MLKQVAQSNMMGDEVPQSDKRTITLAMRPRSWRPIPSLGHIQLKG